VEYNAQKKVLMPFSVFSFHSIIKVDKLPTEAKECTSDGFTYWYSKEDLSDDGVEKVKKYLTSWLECERFLEDSCFDVLIYEP
jgi:hypothetical protein